MSSFHEEKTDVCIKELLETGDKRPQGVQAICLAIEVNLSKYFQSQSSKYTGHRLCPVTPYQAKH